MVMVMMTESGEIDGTGGRYLTAWHQDHVRVVGRGVGVVLDRRHDDARPRMQQLVDATFESLNVGYELGFHVGSQLVAEIEEIVAK